MDLSEVPHAAAVRYVESQLGLPDYIKSAATPPPASLNDEVSDQAFLDMANRQWPSFNKEAAWLSAVAYLSNPRNRDEQLDGRMLKLASVQGITEDVDKLIHLFDDAVKSASQVPEKRYALIVDFEGQGGRGVENFYPVNNYGEVLGSSAQLVKDASETGMPLELVRDAAVNLVKAAREYGVNVSELHRTVELLGTERMADVDHALAIADTREWAGVPPEGIALYKEAAEAVRDGSPEELEDAIACWLELDKLHQVKYARHILDPYQAFFSGEKISEIEKMASEVVLVGDVMIPKSVFGLPSETQLRQSFSKESAEKIMGLQKTASVNAADASRGMQDFNDDERRELLRLFLKCSGAEI